MLLLQEMAVFFILILLGYMARKGGIITPANQSQISSLVIKYASPALIISGAFTKSPKIPFSEAIELLLFYTVMLLIVLLIAEVLARVLKFPAYEEGAVCGTTVFTNIVFMGLPMIIALYGEGAMVYVSLFFIPNNIFFFTYGTRVTSRGMPDRPKLSLKFFVNPGVIAAFLMLFFYFLDVDAPAFITQPLEMVGAMNAPLGMMLIGASLENVRLQAFFRSWRLLIYTAVKMLAIPIIGLWIIKSFTDNTALIGTCFAILATPSAALTVAFAMLYNKKAIPITTQIVSFTTAVSLISMPIVAFCTNLAF